MFFSKTKKLESREEAAVAHLASAEIPPALSAASWHDLVRELLSRGWTPLPPGAWEGTISEHATELAAAEKRAEAAEEKLASAVALIEQMFKTAGDAERRVARKELEIEQLVAPAVNCGIEAFQDLLLRDENNERGPTDD